MSKLIEYDLQPNEVAEMKQYCKEVIMPFIQEDMESGVSLYKIFMYLYECRNTFADSYDYFHDFGYGFKCHEAFLWMTTLLNMEDQIIKELHEIPQDCFNHSFLTHYDFSYVTKINEGAFFYSHLKGEIDLSHVTYIGKQVFMATDVERVILSPDVEYAPGECGISACMFMDCDQLREVIVNPTHPFYILTKAFGGCSQLSFRVPESTEQLRLHVFDDIKHADIPERFKQDVKGVDPYAIWGIKEENITWY